RGSERLFQDRRDLVEREPLDVAEHDRRTVALGERGDERGDVRALPGSFEPRIRPLRWIVRRLPRPPGGFPFGPSVVDRDETGALASALVARDVQGDPIEPGLERQRADAFRRVLLQSAVGADEGVLRHFFRILAATAEATGEGKE